MIDEFLKIGNDWDSVLKEQFSSNEYHALIKKVDEEYNATTVYPPKPLVFSALKTVPYSRVKVVIIGQDPYHEAGQANGMAFAVNNGTKLPPSLVNIYKEIESDLGVTMPKSGTLCGWAKQGVLLLNATLTVKSGVAASHSAFGWKYFTDAIIKKCSEKTQPIVFLLWGSFAIAKKEMITLPHLCLTSVHPSPLSCYRGFFGCKHFSAANTFLLENGLAPIDWTQVDNFEENNIKKGRIVRV